VKPLNLASQPFRNETLPGLLLAVGALVLAGVTLKHALVIRSVLPGRTSGLHAEVDGLEAEAARLRTEARTLRAPRPDAAQLAQWSQLKELVDRRAFSWTTLFAVLEEALPLGVRLLSIAPSVEKGEVTLGLTAVARSYEDGIDFIRVLEERPEFEDVVPKSRDEERESRFVYTMKYIPPPEGAAPLPEAGGLAVGAP
jgi:Tfp pilus assembly protein PilN